MNRLNVLMPIEVIVTTTRLMSRRVEREGCTMSAGRIERRSAAAWSMDVHGTADGNAKRADGGRRGKPAPYDPSVFQTRRGKPAPYARLYAASARRTTLCSKPGAVTPPPTQDCRAQLQRAEPRKTVGRGFSAPNHARL